MVGAASLDDIEASTVSKQCSDFATTAAVLNCSDNYDTAGRRRSLVEATYIHTDARYFAEVDDNRLMAAPSGHAASISSFLYFTFFTTVISAFSGTWRHT